MCATCRRRGCYTTRRRRHARVASSTQQVTARFSRRTGRAEVKHKQDAIASLRHRPLRRHEGTETPTPRPTISSLPTYVRIRAELKSSTFSVKGSAPTRWCRACSPILQRPACVCSLGSCGCSVLPSTSRDDVLLDLWTERFEEAGALAVTVGLGYLQPGKTIVYYRSDGGC